MFYVKVANSQAKLDENFHKYFLKSKTKNKLFIVLKCTCKGLQKSISELERYNALRHFKVDPVLKINETFKKQAESMCTAMDHVYN